MFNLLFATKWSDPCSCYRFGASSAFSAIGYGVLFGQRIKHFHLLFFSCSFLNLELSARCSREINGLGSKRHAKHLSFWRTLTAISDLNFRTNCNFDRCAHTSFRLRSVLFVKKLFILCSTRMCKSITITGILSKFAQRAHTLLFGMQIGFCCARTCLIEGELCDFLAFLSIRAWIWIKLVLGW